MGSVVTQVQLRGLLPTPLPCFPCCHEPETGEMAEGTGPDDLTGAPQGLRGGPEPLPAQPVKRAGCFQLFLG